MDKYGKEIGDAIDQIGGGTIDFGETYGKIARAVNTNLKTLKGQEGYSQLVNLLEDITVPRTFAEAFELKKIIGAELAGLRNGGKAGTPVYKAFGDFVEDVTTKIDSEVLKRSMNLPDLQEAREIYSKLKSISLPFAKSMVVDQRKAPIGIAEQLALIQNFNPIDWVTSPGASVKALAGQKVAQFAKSVNEVNTREGSMKQFFRYLDDMAVARQKGELKDIRKREVKVPKEQPAPLMLEEPKQGAKNRMLSTRKPNVVTQTPEVIYQGKAKPDITERSKIVNPQQKVESVSKNEIPKAETTLVKKAVEKPAVKPAVVEKPPVKEAPKETPTQKFEEKPTVGMTEKERIQYELDKKQAEREFKDVSERVSGSRKEKAQYAKLSMEQYQKVESESAALANDLVTKDRVLATKFEPKVAREA